MTSLVALLKHIVEEVESILLELNIVQRVEQVLSIPKIYIDDMLLGVKFSFFPKIVHTFQQRSKRVDSLLSIHESRIQKSRCTTSM